ncbi:uncharacterized protein LOC112083141 [Eutrema salsugineum]|uniref:uncharacterized protein LOC112083141 n=1 Tax=Eutrema salsugineum TaxID=72664 RepID=UPI000CED3193|nr:uncharacterized protein LOC112083141 [Eutrema salsugineum]
MTAVFRMLAYSSPADSTDEYVKIGVSTAIDTVIFDHQTLTMLHGYTTLVKAEDFQSRFAIVNGPSRFWSKRVLHDIMHNMIIEEERDVDAIIEERTEVPSTEVEIESNEDSRFAIVNGPSRFWSKRVLHDIMHNMIIEEERDVDAIIEERTEVPSTEVEIESNEDVRFQEFLARHRKVKD